MSKRSNLYYIQKFTKELIDIWQSCPDSILDKQNRANETMNYIVMKHVLDKLGFTYSAVNTERSLSTRSRGKNKKQRDSFLPAFRPSDVIQSDEKKNFVSLFDLKEPANEPKLITLWRILGGDYYSHVTLNNLRMILLAIKGLHV